jgi:mRNA interferase RelE/StbE
MYSIGFAETAIKNLTKIPQSTKKSIFSKIEELAENPLTVANVKRLVNFSSSFRLRVGNYRILFERNDEIKTLDIVDVLHRKNAYKRRK